MSKTREVHAVSVPARHEPSQDEVDAILFDLCAKADKFLGEEHAGSDHVLSSAEELSHTGLYASFGIGKNGRLMNLYFIQGRFEIRLPTDEDVIASVSETEAMWVDVLVGMLVRAYYSRPF